MHAEPEPTEADNTAKDLRCGRAVPPMALVRTEELVSAEGLARGSYRIHPPLARCMEDCNPGRNGGKPPIELFKCWMPPIARR